MNRPPGAPALSAPALLAVLCLAACTQADVAVNPNAVLPSGSSGAGDTPPVAAPAPAQPDAPPEEPSDPAELPNSPPSITGPPPVTARAGLFYSHSVTATDPENDPLNYAATGLPTWLTFDSQTGVLSGLPQDEHAGETADIILSVSDGRAIASLDPFQIRIDPMPAPEVPPAPANQPPTITGTPATSVQAGSAYRFRPQANDPDDSNLRFSIANKPAWAEFSTTNGTLSGRPAAGAVGSFRNIVITASDGRLSASLPSFTINVVAAPNRAPAINGTPATSVVAGASYAFTPTANDPDGQTLTYSIANRPTWASFSSSTGRLSGRPTSAHAGDYRNIVITVSDGAGSVSLPAFSIRVEAAAAPTPSPAPSPSPAPAPTPVPAPENAAPTITGQPATRVEAGSTYDFTPTASDPEGQRLIFSIRGRPAWADFSTTTGRLHGTPSAGNYTGIVISASDGVRRASLPAFNIRVDAAPTPTPTPTPPPTPPVNEVPTIVGQPAGRVEAGSTYDFTPTASDPEGQRLTFSIRRLPAWATFDTATGRLRGTATEGNYTGIVISVSDGTGSTSLPSFAIRVDAAPPANTAPTITGQPPSSVTAGTAYNFTPAARDADDDMLAFSISNKPAWATFSTATGRLTGTPTNAHTGEYRNVVISVSDGASSAALPAFSIRVDAAANTAPTISGTPVTSVVAESSYSFTPTARDAEGDPLTFSIESRPVWASFNSSNGRLTGTPSAANVGSYTGIVISVSDGVANRALPAFSIAVTEAAPSPESGEATLSWSAPTSNTDGSPLTDLVGFRIYHGTSPNQLSRSQDIANPRTTTFQYTNLAPGTHYFAVTAYTRSGSESSRSNVGSKTIP